MVPRIATVGSLTLDWLDLSISIRGPLPAGNALYSAVGASLAGASAFAVAKAGNDYPLRLLKTLPIANLSMHLVEVSPVPSYRILLRHDPNRTGVRHFQRSRHDAQLDPDPAQLDGTKVDGVHIAHAPIAVVRRFLERSRQRGCRTSLDLVLIEGEVLPRREDILSLLAHVDVFLPSLQDLRQLWPSAPVASLLDIIHGAGCSQAVIKLGARGCVGSGGSGIVYIPALSRRPVDVTGAEDAFCGAFLTEWIRSGDLLHAMRLGAVVASLVVESYGIIDTMKPESASELLRRLDLVQSCDADYFSLRSL